MSEVIRFKMEFQPSGEVRECVYASDYDATKSELAALREELHQMGLASRDLRIAVPELEKRLTAAEQRNETMSKLLQRCIPVCRYKGSHTERQLINEIEEVCAKPTESGASE